MTDGQLRVVRADHRDAHPDEWAVYLEAVGNYWNIVGDSDHHQPSFGEPHLNAVRLLEGFAATVADALDALRARRVFP